MLPYSVWVETVGNRNSLLRWETSGIGIPSYQLQNPRSFSIHLPLLWGLEAGAQCAPYKCTFQTGFKTLKPLEFRPKMLDLIPMHVRKFASSTLPSFQPSFTAFPPIIQTGSCQETTQFNPRPSTIHPSMPEGVHGHIEYHAYQTPSASNYKLPQQ